MPLIITKLNLPTIAVGLCRLCCFMCTNISVFSLVQFVLCFCVFIFLYSFVLNPAYMLAYFNKPVCVIYLAVSDEFCTEGGHTQEERNSDN